MSTLAVPPALWNRLREDLLSTPEVERAAVGFAGVVNNGARSRLLLRDWAPVLPDEYLVQLGYHLEVSGEVWARAAKRARGSNEAIVILHSHPQDHQVPAFSSSDDAGETDLIPKLQARAPVPVGAVVVSPGGHRARLRAPSRAVADMEVEILGQPVKSDSVSSGERFDRQIRALTREGQAAIGALSVGVVGAGGLGSHVIQQLLHLGIGELVIVDPDRVATSNLSRLVGAGRRDARLRRSKVRIARRIARRLGGPTKLTELNGAVEDAPIARRLRQCDVIVGCTDNQLSRTVLNAIAYQYYVPILDLGVELQPGGAMGGRVNWLAPGSPCLWCSGVLNAERVRVEQLPPALVEAEHERGYIQGINEPAPAVVSINGVIASVAVTELLARWTGFADSQPRANMLLYRLVDGTLRRTKSLASAECPTCGPNGVLGAGDLASPPWS